MTPGQPSRCRWDLSTSKEQPHGGGTRSRLLGGWGSQSPSAHSHPHGKARTAHGQPDPSHYAADTGSVPGACGSPVNWVWAEPTPVRAQALGRGVLAGSTSAQGSPRRWPGSVRPVFAPWVRGWCPCRARDQGTTQRGNRRAVGDETGSSDCPVSAGTVPCHAHTHAQRQAHACVPWVVEGNPAAAPESHRLRRGGSKAGSCPQPDQFSQQQLCLVTGDTAALLGKPLAVPVLVPLSFPVTPWCGVCSRGLVVGGPQAPRGPVWGLHTRLGGGGSAGSTGPVQRLGWRPLALELRVVPAAGSEPTDQGRC